MISKRISLGFVLSCAFALDAAACTQQEAKTAARVTDEICAAVSSTTPPPDGTLELKIFQYLSDACAVRTVSKVVLQPEALHSSEPDATDGGTDDAGK